MRVPWCPIIGSPILKIGDHVITVDNIWRYHCWRYLVCSVGLCNNLLDADPKNLQYQLKSFLGRYQGINEVDARLQVDGYHTRGYCETFLYVLRQNIDLLCCYASQK